MQCLHASPPLVALFILAQFHPGFVLNLYMDESGFQNSYTKSLTLLVNVKIDEEPKKVLLHPCMFL